MEYRRMGSSGLRLSALSLGAWITYGGQVSEGAAEECMSAAFDAGVNFFDNAEAYDAGNAESVMGRVIRKQGWKRSDLVVSTKIFWGGKGPNDRGLSKKHIAEAIDASLGRLGMDYVDLVFCHRPDYHTPIEETVWAMDLLIRRGKALYWGTSEWSAEEFTRATLVARREHLVPPVVEQPEYNMFRRERVEVEYAPLYREFGMGTTIWSPLASGVLTGKYNDGIPAGSRLSLPGYEWLRDSALGHRAAERIDKVKTLSGIARELGCTTAQLAVAWCLKNPNVSTVITGATHPRQVRENMESLAVAPRLTDEVMERIEGALKNKPRAPQDYR
ncbi:MAG: voltage-dependent potassium channel, beta subunit [Candidatus Krumholzibacteriota bacterium]|nr:voltage-dependent potassium channel, beta subunit [Candidatus Krumholzibacteriota bacterium]